METVTPQQFADFVPYITVPALALTVLSFVLAITRRAGDTGAIEQRDAWHIRALVVAWAAWGFASAALSLSGAYTSEAFYALLPGLWMPLVPALIFALYFAVSRGPHDGLGKVIRATPLHWLVYFHALRISAARTAFETARGEVPGVFRAGGGRARPALRTVGPLRGWTGAKGLYWAPQCRAVELGGSRVDRTFGAAGGAIGTTRPDDGVRHAAHRSGAFRLSDGSRTDAHRAVVCAVQPSHGSATVGSGET